MNGKLLIKGLYFPMCLRLQIVEMKEHMGRGLVDERNCCWWPSTTKTLLASVGRNGTGTWRHPQHPHCCRSSMNIDGSC